MSEQRLLTHKLIDKLSEEEIAYIHNLLIVILDESEDYDDFEEQMTLLSSKLMEAEQQRLSGAKPYTTNQVRDYIRELHHANV